MAGIAGISARIDKIYREIYSDRILSRFRNFHFVYETMAKTTSFHHPEVQLHLDVEKLAELVRSYFIDVIRYKEYHFNPDKDDLQGRKLDVFSREWSDLVHKKRINSSKVATLSVKWVLAYKPISVISDAELTIEEEVKTHLAHVNENYALNIALSALGVEETSVPQPRIEELLYNFRFRGFEEGGYYLLLSKEFLTAPLEDNGAD